MQRLSTPWETLLIAAIVVLATVCAQAQAQEAEEGKVVTIDDDAGGDDFDVEEEVRIVDEAAYWIGIQGRSIESEVLRTHLQLAAEMGVVVEQVIDESPAAKAGLRRHDIILRANGDAIDNMRVLQQHVREGKDQPLELKIIRLGEKENLVVVPELRPAQLNVQPNEMDRFRRLGFGDGDLMQQLMQQFGNRNIGPGMVFRGGGAGVDFNQMPNGISVSVQRNANQPAQITVRRGDETWQIVGDDEQSLEQLPDDVRPFVERMLNGQGNVQAFGGNGGNGFGGDFDLGNLNEEIEKFLPGGLGGLDNFRDRPRRNINRQELELRQRMERLENRLKELQGRFELDRFDEGVGNPVN
ncbi:MAG: PDZ domain-containing protein [Planctomycetota bacterium]